MSARASNIKPAIVPTIRYRDVPAMVTWLCDTFGFEKQLIVPDDAGKIALAQLKYGDSLIMIGPVQQSAMDKLMTQPDEIGDLETQICYLLVPDADAHCERAKAAGAEIVFDVEIILNTKAGDYGGRGYMCRDPEGHIWNFGTYDPWRAQRGPIATEPQVAAPPPRRSALVGILVMFGVAAAIVGAWIILTQELGLLPRRTVLSTADEVSENGETDVGALLAQQRALNEVKEQLAREARQQLARAVAAKEATERAARSAEDQLAQERAARVEAEALAREAADQLERERSARGVADRTAKDATDRLSRESIARSTAERQAREAGDQLVPERNARAAAELAAAELRNELLQLRRAESMGGSVELREQLNSERVARNSAEQAAKITRQQLIHEKALKEAAEDALRQAQEKLTASQATATCWVQPPPATQCRQP